MKPLHFFAVILSGTALGGLVGYLTRPTLMGIPLPLAVLFSTARGDAPFRAELASHLAMTIGIGAIGAGILLFALTYLSNNRATRS